MFDRFYPGMAWADHQAQPHIWPHAQHSRLVQAGGIQWHVQQMGQGPCMLLLHGTGSGHFSWRGLLPKLVEHFARKAPQIELGNLHVEREFNDVRMVCESYLALLQHGQSGETYNICSGQTYTLQQVLDTLVQLTGHQLQVNVNPAFVRATEVHKLCGNPQRLHQILAQAGITCSQPSLAQTLQAMLNESHVADAIAC